MKSCERLVGDWSRSLVEFWNGSTKFRWAYSKCKGFRREAIFFELLRLLILHYSI
jgi:hypothetical protein